MIAVMMAIKPRHIKRIVAGEKEVELRKTMPKKVPFKAYMYETKNEGGSGKVVGEFTVTTFAPHIKNIPILDIAKLACTTEDSIEVYMGKAKQIYCLFIKKGSVKVYNRPKDITEFFVKGSGIKPMIRPPQSWCYIEEV